MQQSSKYSAMNECDGLFEGTKYYGAIGMQNLSAPMSPAKTRPDALNGYHILLTTPFFCKHPDKKFVIADFYLSTMKLSALTWKKYNGAIYMLTDQPGLEYLTAQGFGHIYSDILPILTPDLYGIDHQRYWASGKIQAVTKINVPFVILDLDLIIWNVLNVEDCDIAAAHTERISEDAYPDLSFFDMSPRYKFPSEWSRNALPLNTSILYLRDDAFKDYYTSSSIRFMQYERNTPDDGVRCMCFAEQRILAMCVEAKHQRVKTYLDYDQPLAEQHLITHLWSCKTFLRHSPYAARKYIELCEEKISQLQKEGL